MDKTRFGQAGFDRANNASIIRRLFAPACLPKTRGVAGEKSAYTSIYRKRDDCIDCPPEVVLVETEVGPGEMIDDQVAEFGGVLNWNRSRTEQLKKKMRLGRDR